MVKIFTPAYWIELTARGVPRCKEMESAKVFTYAEGIAQLRRLTEEYVALGVDGIATHTFRCSPAYVGGKVEEFNSKALEIAMDAKSISHHPSLYVFGSIGPMGRNAYHPLPHDTTDAEIRVYHQIQAKTLVKGGVDRLLFETISDRREGLAAVRLAEELAIPISVSFALDQKGNLRDGTPLSDAIRWIDTQTKNYASSFMMNCSSVDRIRRAIRGLDDEAQGRIGGLYANAAFADPVELEGSKSPVNDIGADAYSHFVRGMIDSHHLIRDTKENPFWVSGCCGFSHDIGVLVRQTNGMKSARKLSESPLSLIGLEARF